VYTIGQVVAPGETLMTIVPVDAELEVVDVSNNSVDDEKRGLVFPVRVAMDRGTIRVNGEDMKPTPGMSVTVDVKTGRRRVIEYIMTPLLRYRDEAIRER
tara:strand:- start:1421 stop:1720 length:300 start_codon:yes stop_codon:yes gene_type:complete